MTGSGRFILMPALLICVASLVHAQGLKSVETDYLRLLYFDPTETYLVPRTLRSRTPE